MSFESLIVLFVMQVIFLASIIFYMDWLRDFRRTKTEAIKLLKSYLLEAACFRRDLVAFATVNDLIHRDWFYNVSFEEQILSVSKSLEFYSNPLILHDLTYKKSRGQIDSFIFSINNEIRSLNNYWYSLNKKRANPYFNKSLPSRQVRH